MKYTEKELIKDIEELCMATIKYDLLYDKINKHIKKEYGVSFQDMHYLGNETVYEIV